MKKTLAGALFVALGAAATGAGALNDISLQGSDTLKPLTIAVIANCPGATGLTYAGGGSGAGEGALKAGSQTVAPMSRFLAAGNVCAFSTNPIEAEALQVGLDALSIVVHKSHRAACDPDSPPTGAACTKDVATGIKYTVPTCLAGGDWKAVLRMIYFGLTPADLSNSLYLSERDCNDQCRIDLVNNWGNMFENACSGGDCTKLQHAFRRDENSGTTDAFRDLLSVRVAPDYVADGNKGFPFCNEYDPGVVGVTPDPANPSVKTNDVVAACPPIALAGSATGAPGLPPRPYFDLYQDNDPIRRTAIGTGNLNINLSSPPPSAPTEQVASARGDLGLVLPISVPPLSSSVTNAERHARIGTVDRGGVAVPTQYCTRGFVKLAAAPTIAALVSGDASGNCNGVSGPGYALCPNGDVPKGACFDNVTHISIGGVGLCPYPVFDADGDANTSADQDFRCINGANNRPTISTGVNQMSAAIKAACVNTAFDGRVYNLHPHNASGNYVTQAYTYSGPYTPPVPATGQRQVVGAFYRMHETRTAVTGASDCAGDNCCQLDDSTDQIGCLVGANPCSIGFAGENSLNQEVATTAGGPQGVYGASLNGVESARACVLSNAYPLSRFLWVSTMIGYQTSGGVAGDELELAKCYSGNGLASGTIQSMVNAEGFQAIPIGCRSFDETSASTGCTGTAPATNSCSNNPSGVASLLGVGEACTAAAQCASGICTSSKCSL
jgi:ABC-type phosphate transport system substrate-binding protein